MSQENQSYLRFSLEESVWFQKGQEVDELLSIPLDPIITVLESDQYVNIRGSLELSGEYKCTSDGTIEQEEDYSTTKFIHSIEEREEGVNEFIHRFPVDITIPNNRIESLEKLDITIDSFDYVIPERSCINLSAELTISGLYGEQQNSTVEETEQEANPQQEEYQELELIHRSANEENEGEYEPFEVEARKQPEPQIEAVDEGTVWENPLQGFEEAKTPDISFAAKRSETPVPPVADFEENVTYQNETDFQIDVVASDEVESSSVESSSEQEVEVKKKKVSNKKSMSIAEFLGRKTESEQHAKLKVCIVQNGETLEALAERYEISAQQILKVNHLEANQDIYEGQVLYIPVGTVTSISR